MSIRKPRKRLYKPERKPARVKAWANPERNQLTDCDITEDEAMLAIYTIGKRQGLEVGRVLGYDIDRDEFLALAKDHSQEKIVEMKVKGQAVASVVRAAKQLNFLGMVRTA